MEAEVTRGHEDQAGASKAQEEVIIIRSAEDPSGGFSFFDESNRNRYIAAGVLVVIALVLTVPASVFISSRIEATYQDSIDNTIQAAEITAQAAEDTTEQMQREEATNPIEFFQQRIEDLSMATNNITETLKSAVEWMQTMISNFFEAFAVMIVLSCIIPIIVLIFLLWVVKLILGVNIDVPMSALRRGSVGRMIRKA